MRREFPTCGINMPFDRLITKSKNQLSECPKIVKPAATGLVQQRGMMDPFSARGKQVPPEEQENLFVPR
jgi:hypothetical protein